LIEKEIVLIKKKNTMKMWRTTGIHFRIGVLRYTFLALFLICLSQRNVNGERMTTTIDNGNGNGNGFDDGSGNGDIQALIDLHEENWRDMLKGEWMVEFFAPWCPACKSLAPTWARFARSIIESNVKVAQIDVTNSPSLSGRFFVTALPTIYHVKNGEFRQYRGSRDEDALVRFIRLKEWKSIEAISAWKKPDTIHMSILSFFFKLSHTLKDFNGRLQEEYGLPSWGSYLLFAIGTVFVGAALGLLLVCVVDFLYPMKKTHRQSFAETRDQDDGIEDLAKEEIEDDITPAKKGKQSNNVDDDAEDDDVEGNKQTKLDDEDDSTSEGEKYSQDEGDSDDDDGETNENENENADDEKTKKSNEIKNIDVNDAAKVVEEATGRTTGDVRKRKPRKAD